ncbi:MAG: sugar phosphate nucleotidyltransferase [Ignavibacterium sp.]
MRAIIPVAGIGSRLKPHTYTIPKVLLNVGDKPILGHIIDKLLDEDINKATFICGHLGELVIEYVKKNYPNLNSNFVEQKELEGLGHAIHTAIPTFDDDEIFIILGDTIFDVDLKAVFAKNENSLGVKTIDDPSRFGVVVLKDGYVEKLVEKPKTFISNLALVGLYYIKQPDVLIDSLNTLVKNNIRTKGELQLTDALQLMIDNGVKFSTFSVEGWYDCGKPETLLATNRYLLNKLNNQYNISDVVVIPPVFISPSAKIENSIIGPYASISDNTKIYDSIIKNSIIGSNAEVKRSLLDNSIIGNNTIIHGSYRKLNTGDSTEIDIV